MKVLMIFLLIGASMGQEASNDPSKRCIDLDIARCIRPMGLKDIRLKENSEICNEATTASQCMSQFRPYCPPDMMYLFNIYNTMINEVLDINCRGKKDEIPKPCPENAIPSCLTMDLIPDLDSQATAENCQTGREALRCLVKLGCSGELAVAVDTFKKKLIEMIHAKCPPSKETQ